MFRGSNLPGPPGAAADASLKRQFEDGDANNGLSMNLQDQYADHEAEQAAKRQRGMGMPGGDFGAPFPGAGMGMNGMAGAAGGGGAMGGMNADALGMNAGGMNPMGMNPMAGAPGGMGGMNPMAGAGMAGAAGMNPMAGAGMPGGMQGMNSMGGMNGMNHMGAGAGMGAGGMQGMNPMNMAAARAGRMGGFQPQGMPGLMNDDIAAALYMNGFDGAGAAGMGLLGQRGAGLGFMAQGAGHLGGLGAFGDYGRLAQNPYAGLGGMGAAGAPGVAANAAAMGVAANAAAMGGAAPLGLPGSNARRAQLMALMDMENEIQQQQEAAKVGSANPNFPPGGGGNAPTPAGNAAGGSQQEFMAGGGGQRNNMNNLPSTAAELRTESQDADSLANNSGPTQAPEPPMDIPTFSTASTPAVLPLPPVIEEGAASHYSQRAHIPLGIDEDNNWLTEFQCFIRFDLIEVVQASRHVDQMNAAGKNSGSSGETFQQVGVRCRYCAHLHPGQRASRSSAFPSSIRQLYQSFTMMLRDHFEQCSEIPPLRKKLFSELKAKNSQGAYDSKQYWIYAAEKLGMMDSEHGIQMTAESQSKARRQPPFGTVGSTPHTHSPPKLLVNPEDIRITSDFLYTLISQVQVVHLIDSERVGKRKTLRVGLPGFGCRYCCHVGRCGLSRMFPLRRRMLPGKVNEIYEHVKRCTLFPTKEKELLARLKVEDKTSPEQEKEFFDRIWERLGCESEVKK